MNLVHTRPRLSATQLAIETFTPSVIIAEQDVVDGTTAECIEKARIHGEPASAILISDLVDLKQMIRAINQNDVFQFLLRPFDDDHRIGWRKRP